MYATRWRTVSLFEGPVSSGHHSGVSRAMRGIRPADHPATCQRQKAGKVPHPAPVTGSHGDR